MKLFTCTSHDGFYPVPTASIVIATGIEEAQRVLDIHLEENDLKPFKKSPYKLVHVKGVSIKKREPMAIILSNGDY